MDLAWHAGQVASWIKDLTRGHSTLPLCYTLPHTLTQASPEMSCLPLPRCLGWAGKEETPS